MLRPLGEARQTLALQVNSIAELMRACGVFVDLAPGDTARDHELKLEARFFQHGLCRYRCRREPDPDDPWTFIASVAQDVEQVLRDYLIDFVV